MAKEKVLKKAKNADKTKKKVETSERSKYLSLVAEGLSDMIYADDKEEVCIVPNLLTGVNRAFVIGGWPLGTIAEIHGPNGGGKTAVGVAQLASAQRMGNLVAFCDAEKAANDKKWLSKGLGLDLSNCLYFNPECFEDAAERINKMIRNFRTKQRKGQIPKDMSLWILVDSVAKLVPKEELEGKVGKRNFGLLANLMSQWLRQLVNLVGDTNKEKSMVAVMFINQERVNVGAKPWEPAYKSFGGEALQFDAHVRLRVYKQSWLRDKTTSEDSEGSEESGVKIGKVHKLIVEKNKTGFPDSEATFYTGNGRGDAPYGFDFVREAITEALYRGVITKPTKGKFDYNGKEFSGEKRMRKYFNENPKELKKLIDKLNAEACLE